jgi:clan AA aspartic protease
MIVGQVNDHNEAVVTLRLRNSSGDESDIEVVVDTGFTASLALPTALIDLLGLAIESQGKVVLADGTVRGVNVYMAELAWGDDWLTVYVHSLDNETLLGMRLLTGHDLRIAVTPGGSVEITPLP